MMLWNGIKRLLREDDGLETVEWAIVGTVVVIAAIVAFTAVGTNTNLAMTAIADTIPPGGGTGS